jgi:exodeoxyribonuclease VII small subunit
MSDTTDPPRFADGLAALEALVAQLESGELALEDALRAFEDGVGLVRTLNAQLGAAEERVQILIRGAGGPRLRRAEDDEL